MSESLPTFRYHPDPLGTGFVEPSSTACVACERERGFIYTGPVYAIDDLQSQICPRCIADGSAAERFDATFTDAWGTPADVPMPVLDEITRRTPGYSGWQQEHWLYHCGDGCAFIGPVGRKELVPFRCLHCGTHLAFSDFT